MVRGKTPKGPKHLTWNFNPKLENEKYILFSILDKYPIEYYSKIVNCIRSLITSLVRNHGFTDGPKRYNIIKNYTISLIERRNPENPEWLSTSDVYKIPSKLGVEFIQLIIDYINCTEEVLLPKYYQVIITILNIVRMIDGLSKPDYESVLQKAIPIENSLLQEFSVYTEEKLKNFKYTKADVNLFKYRFNLRRNGPNGKPKAESAFEEAITLLNSKLHLPFKRICAELNCDYLYEYLCRLKEEIPEIRHDQVDKNPRFQTFLRKIVSVPDSGFKTRLVAIVDFWSQLIMMPVRDHVQFVTEKLYGNTDFRKSHTDGVAAMVSFQKRCLERESIGSHVLHVKHLKFYDISSWTDRFHRDLQKILMRHLFTPRLSEAWAQLYVHCDWYSPDLKRTVKYGQGQGMGTNGSFDIATLTDHLLINFLIDRKSTISGLIQNNCCYGKVGDDLWIYDPDSLIPEYYEKISLPINFSKSKEYNGKNSIAEFCSRTFIDGVDVSRISPKIISRSREFRYIPLLLSVCSERGVQLDRLSFDYLDRQVKGTEDTYFDKLEPWIISLLVISKYEQSSYLKYLTLDYLDQGNWLRSDFITKLRNDQLMLDRLAIAHSIVSIVDSTLDIKVKLSDIMGELEVYGFDFFKLCSENENLFNINSEHMEIALQCRKVPSKTLLPKDIIIFGRFVDQRNLIRKCPDWTDNGKVENLVSLEGDSYIVQLDNVELLEDISKFATQLQLISSRSCYDQGNILYDTKRVFGFQCKIKKTIERLNEDFSKLTMDREWQIRDVFDYYRMF